MVGFLILSTWEWELICKPNLHRCNSYDHIMGGQSALLPKDYVLIQRISGNSHRCAQEQGGKGEDTQEDIRLSPPADTFLTALGVNQS